MIYWFCTQRAAAPTSTLRWSLRHSHLPPLPGLSPADSIHCCSSDCLMPWDYTQLESFCTAKGTSSRVKRELTEQERRRSLPGIHGQRLVSRIYRDPKRVTLKWRSSSVMECLPSMVEALGLKNPAQRRLTSFAKRINRLYHCPINVSC